ncbi:MAG: zinc transporter ZIP family [Puniceicoccaceae bacterium 5H]|nr:MAG: zinc transporter ZIP family [Puniceicoccaceae bacterium 5H]
MWTEITAWFRDLDPVWQALLAGCFTWSVTALGAAVVVFTKNVNQRMLDVMMGFAAGVMIAASFWSLLAPAIEIAENRGTPSWLPAVVGFLGGGAFLRIGDKLLPHLHVWAKSPEGPSVHWRRATLLVTAITLHNIPEGLAVGVSFGALAHETNIGMESTFGAAVALAIGIGLQNFPEGTSVSVPLRGEGMSRRKAFWYGQLSGIVEPIAAVIGAVAVVAVSPLLPYALAFAAGAMIFVVVEELIPESQSHDNTDEATLGALVGFALMMFLDVALG